MMSKTEKNMLPSAMPMNDYGSYDFGHRGRGRGETTRYLIAFRSTCYI